MAPWLVPIIAMLGNKQQEKSAREGAAMQEGHDRKQKAFDIQMQLARELGDPGYGAQAASFNANQVHRGKLLDRQLAEQARARNAALVQQWSKGFGQDTDSNSVAAGEQRSEDVGAFADDLWAYGLDQRRRALGQ